MKIPFYYMVGRSEAARSRLVRRTIHPEVRVLDANAGLCEYVASDETVDSYREVIRADGWRFDHFRKNAPFVDSHDYSTVENQVGRVVGFRVEGRRLVEAVQWAIDVPENKLAALGWAMTKAGYLRAVSVGFQPARMLTRWDRDPAAFDQLCGEMRLKPEEINAIYTEQQQLELSACIVGANPNALARSYKAGLLTDADLDLLSAEHARRESVTRLRCASARQVREDVMRENREQQRDLWLRHFEELVKAI